jgi:radical S-adenosyl methionine domain-containing protein 2
MKENLAINYHLCTRCTMRCRYCFARFRSPVRGTMYGSLEKPKAMALTRLLASSMGKVTFVGGEPTLVPWLRDLIDAAKVEGATTMLVTNGSMLTPATVRSLASSLDWLGLSIDSADQRTHELLGRSVDGKALSAADYIALCAAAHSAGMRVKVNTVVTSINKNEDMSQFVEALGPERWKVFKVLEVQGQNERALHQLAIPDLAFKRFVSRHRQILEPTIPVVAENNDAMTGSYLMVDPAGRLFDNVTGCYRFSDPILDVGLDAALQQIHFSRRGFADRGGAYEWGLPSGRGGIGAHRLRIGTTVPVQSREGSARGFPASPGMAPEI